MCLQPYCTKPPRIFLGLPSLPSCSPSSHSFILLTFAERDPISKQNNTNMRYLAIWISGTIRTAILLFLQFVRISSEISMKGMKNYNRKGKCQKHRKKIRCAGQQKKRLGVQANKSDLQGTRDYNSVICGLRGHWRANLKLCNQSRLISRSLSTC